MRIKFLNVLSLNRNKAKVGYTKHPDCVVPSTMVITQITSGVMITVKKITIDSYNDDYRNNDGKRKKQYYDDKYYTKILEPPETKKGAEEVI